MRSFDEIGKFIDCPTKVNEAYQVYASIYLDFVDNSLSHFFNREIDTRPVEDVPNDPEAMTSAYLDAAAGIARDAMREEDGVSAISLEDILDLYPLLQSRLAS